MELSAAHGWYAAGTLIIILTMLLRRVVVLPALAGTFLVTSIYSGSLVTGFQAIFNANLVAAGELFNIFLIIAFMVALLRSLRDLGADRSMMRPMGRMMVNGHLSFFLLAGMTYVLSLFFWPTPAVPLIGALLLPSAVRAGLPPIGGAVAIAIAGQGMALSSDYVMRVAPTLSAKSGGLDPAQVADQALFLSLVTGAVALLIAYGMLHKRIGKREGLPESVFSWEEPDRNRKADGSPWRKPFAVLVPSSLLAVMAYMVYSKVSGTGTLEGEGGAALIGGVAAMLLMAATLAHNRRQAVNRIAEHLVEGFLFAFRTMGPVIPIAGYFFLGSGDFSGAILNIDQGPPFLFDLVRAGQTLIPESGVLTVFGVLVIGMITGLDGSGFSGLPLTGGLAGSLAGPGIDPTTLAAIGQMGSIWTGGGTIVAWSSLVAVAGFAGVSVTELVRRNFFPVVVGLLVSTLVALLIW
ncbi:MAG: hypothetical protein M0Z65_09340 [Firmicutes bacterium]|nr:hypothetical protein [Bacillota bacterium]